MMYFKKTSSFSLGILLILLSGGCSKNASEDRGNKSIHFEDKTLLQGVVFDPKCDTLILAPSLKDSRINRVLIPVVDGKFKYELHASEVQAFELILKNQMDKGYWHPVKFYNDADNVSFEIHSFDNFEKNQIIGGKLNNESKAINNNLDQLFRKNKEPYRDSIDILDKTNKYYSETAKIILKQLRNNNSKKDSLRRVLRKLRDDNLDLTEEAKFWNTKMDSIDNLQKAWEFQYLEKHYSLVSYENLLNDLLFLEKESDLVLSRNVNSIGEGQTTYFKPYDVSTLKKYLSIYEEKFPNHSYNNWLREKIESLNNIKVGGSFIDFTAPTLTSENITISDYIDNEITVLNLWASWCGPCIEHSIELIPVFEKYKTKGLDVIAVAREHENTLGMERMIDRWKFPWINLIDLNGELDIWEKYNISNAGGAIILIDKNGKIIAINPSILEIETEILKRTKNKTKGNTP